MGNYICEMEKCKFEFCKFLSYFKKVNETEPCKNAAC